MGTVVHAASVVRLNNTALPVLQLVARVPATLVLVAAEDGDRRHRIRGKDGISHAGVTKRFRVAGKVPRIAERHVESLP